MAVLPETNGLPPNCTDDPDDARRAREFYHYFQPDNLVLPRLRRRASLIDILDSEVPDLSKALSPIAQLTTLRMKCRKTMINVMDRDVMYFLSEATRIVTGETEEIYEFIEDPILSACSSVSLKGRICDLTIRLENDPDLDEVPMFVINDLTKSQFAEMAIISGPPYYRSYAGIPITTRDGINIGSLAIMDTRTRPEGLTQAERSFMAITASQIMVFLETNRQAIEGQQSRKMAEGLEAFIGGRKSIHDEKAGHGYHVMLKKRSKAAYGLAMPLNGEVPASILKPFLHNKTSLEQVDEVSTSGHSSDTEDAHASPEVETESRTHAKTFGRAANILRECMGNLGEDGAVVFANVNTRTATSATKKAPISVRTPESVNGESYSAAASVAVMAYSTESDDVIPEKGLDDRVKFLPEDVLKELIRRYPGGRLFTLDGNAASSSEEEPIISNEQRRLADTIPRTSRRKQRELIALRTAFPAASQVLFTPLWDATTGSFPYTCFVATAVATRSFTASIELPFLNSFCNTLMGECSRLDTILADKQKGDFVGTISHEMRSPLHGLLASVEFLAETELSSFQRSLITTIDSCGRTLLDTINHVLDFSKINSFQKHWQASNKKHPYGSRRHTFLGPENTSKTVSQGAPALLQLLGVVDVSAVLEEVIDGLVLGHTFTSGIDLTDLSREARGRGRTPAAGSHLIDPVKITLDIQKAEWVFLTQPGAIRRIIMNLTGNAIKYTNQGSIHVRLQLIQPLESDGVESMLLTVADTGKGISQEFLNSKLFLPFAQENSLAPGTGLGLSIVRSIVLMLGGAIHVKSKLREGTIVEVTLPVKRPLPGQNSTQTTPYSDTTIGTNSTSGSGTDNSLLVLWDEWASATVTVFQSEPLLGGRIRSIIESYVRDWYGLSFLDQRLCDSSTVVIVEEADLEPLLSRLVSTPGRRPALVVLCSVLSRHSVALVQSLEERIGSAVEFVSEPCGPHKLARSLRLALENQATLQTRILGPSSQHLAPLTLQLADLTPTAPGPECITADLAEMDLNLPGENDDAKIVQATETFAASQASQNAQMALHDPITAIKTPRNHVSEGDSFPFPMHEQENSRMRRESDRLWALNKGGDEANLTPVAERNSEAPTPKALAEKVDPRVLLVDDNRINLRLLDTFLRNKRKYSDIVQVEDGQQAVEAVKSAPQPFDIIYMDISMPVMDGFEATRCIREFEDGNGTKPGAMIIALTGLASARDQTEVFNCGCDIYMTKPVSFKEVGKLLNNWEAHRVSRPD